MASGDIKGFYRQKKKGVGVSKPPHASSISKRKSASLLCADPVQPRALISQEKLGLEEDHKAEEGVLRQFDMDTRYGPCLGISRMERWERARAMGLDPPPEVAAMLRSAARKVEMGECLWEGRV